MRKVILEFTLNGRKHTYFRRLDVYGEAVTTTNKDSAHLIRESDVPGVVKALVAKYGKDNVKDINPIKNDG